MGETSFIYLIYGRSSRSVKVLFALCSTQCWVGKETGFLSLGFLRYSYDTLPVFRQFQNSNIHIGFIGLRKWLGQLKICIFVLTSHF